MGFVPGVGQHTNAQVVSEHTPATLPSAHRDLTQEQQKPSPNSDLEASLRASELYEAMKGGVWGLGTDEAKIFRALDGISKDQGDKIRHYYQDHYHRNLDQDLRQELENPTERRRAELSLNGQSTEAIALVSDKEKQSEKTNSNTSNSTRGGANLSDAEKLHKAMEGIGTREEDALSVIEGRSKADIAAIKADYKDRYARDLAADLENELSGRDKFRAQMALRGEPESSEERLDRVREARDFERSGVSGAVIDVLTDKGRRLDDNLNRAEQALKSAKADGNISAQEQKRIAELTSFAEQDVGSLIHAKDSASDGVATGAAVAAATVVVVGSGGAATPLVVGLATAAGAGGYVAGKAAVQGRGYDTSEGLAADVAVGAVEGALTAVTAGGSKLAEGAIKTTAQIAAEGAVSGAVSGAGGSAVRTATQEETWKDGVAPGLERVGVSTAVGAVTGAAGGAAGSVVTSGAGKILRAAKESMSGNSAIAREAAEGAAAHGAAVDAPVPTHTSPSAEAPTQSAPKPAPSTPTPQPGTRVSTNGKAVYIEDPEQLKSAYQTARVEELTKQAPEVDVNEHIAQAKKESEGVVAFFDRETGKMYLPEIPPGLSSTDDRAIAGLSLAAHESAHQSGKGEALAWRAQADYLERRGLELDFSEGSPVIRRPTPGSPLRHVDDETIENYVESAYGADREGARVSAASFGSFKDLGQAMGLDSVPQNTNRTNWLSQLGEDVRAAWRKQFPTETGDEQARRFIRDNILVPGETSHEEILKLFQEGSPIAVPKNCTIQCPPGQGVQEVTGRSGQTYLQATGTWEHGNYSYEVRFHTNERAAAGSPPVFVVTRETLRGSPRIKQTLLESSPALEALSKSPEYQQYLSTDSRGNTWVDSELVRKIRMHQRPPEFRQSDQRLMDMVHHAYAPNAAWEK